MTNKRSYLQPFIPRICSTPHCNHPTRGRPICCRGCLQGQHTPTCTQRALKMIQQRNGNQNEQQNENENENDDNLQYIPLTSPRLIRSDAQSNYCLEQQCDPQFPSLISRRTHSRSHSQTNGSNVHHRNNHKYGHRHRRSQSTLNYLYCDQCRIRFHCLHDLERHKATHHGPPIAVPLSSRPRMPAPIPELTSSYHTTMPMHSSRTPFRYKQSDNLLPMLHQNNTNNENPMSSFSRLNLIKRRKKKKQTNNRQNDFKLSQLFSTYFGRNNEEKQQENDDNDNEDVVMMNDDDNEEEEKKQNNNESADDLIRRRRSLVINNENDTFSDTDNQIIDGNNNNDVHRKKLHELKQKLAMRKQRKKQRNDQQNMVRPKRKRSFSSAHHRPRHRRSPAIHNILPFITNEDEDENDEDEEAKSSQPLPTATTTNNNGNNNMDALNFMALRRKARNRNLRRSNSLINIPPHYRQLHEDSQPNHNENANPFRQHRRSQHRHHHHSGMGNWYRSQHRLSATSASMMELHRERSHNHTNHSNASSNSSHVQSILDLNPQSVAPNNQYRIRRTNRRNSTFDDINLQRLRAPPLLSSHVNSSNNDSMAHRRQRLLTSQQQQQQQSGLRYDELMRLYASSQTNNDQKEDANEENEEKEEEEDETNSIDSLVVNRDEEIARLLQQRDSLLTHFEAPASPNLMPMHRPSQSLSAQLMSSSFDINALRQRNFVNRHRRSQSCNMGMHKVNVNDLPIRCIEVSDIGKGKESLHSCSICQERFQIGDKVKYLPCFHFFHVDEIDRWLKTSRVCPVCRHSIDEVNFK